MRATLFRERLLAALDRVRHAAPSAPTIPILSHVLIEAADGVLKLRASDCDLEIASTAAGDVREAGATTVAAAMLHRLVGKLPDEDSVTLELIDAGRVLSIVAGRLRARLHTLPVVDFPLFPLVKDAQSFSMPGAALHHLLATTIFAAAIDKSRYNLQGVYLHVAKAGSGGHVLRAVATNGHILALADARLPEGAAGFAGAIISRKAVAELIRLLAPDDDPQDAAAPDVTLTVSPRLIRASFAGTTLAFRPLDASFPDYGRVLPYSNDKLLTIDRVSFLAALDRVGTAAVGSALKIELASGRVALSARSFVKASKDSGYVLEISGSEELDADYSDDALAIGANDDYLASIVAKIGGAQVVARFSDPSMPILLQAPESSSRLFVLMPMRV